MQISANTQAILLLTAPLFAGRGSETPTELLTLGQYKLLARALHEKQKQPSDLITPNADEVNWLIDQIQPVIDPDRLRRLLGRGFLLSQAVDQWQSRSIWVLSRADPEYPKRLKMRLKENAPPILYGCGDIALLELGGLAVVGSRDADEVLLSYTTKIGALIADAQRIIVSGGARGIDQTAMKSTLDFGGRAIGVLSDSLEKTALSHTYRDFLRTQRLVFISPYDPRIGFNIPYAMQRNKIIYALADCALVVNSDLLKGGTWNGAVEQLDKLHFVPIYVRSEGKQSEGLEELKRKGAMPWPDPITSNDLDLVFTGKAGTLSSPNGQTDVVFSKTIPSNHAFEPSVPLPVINEDTLAQSTRTIESPFLPSEELFAKVRELIIKGKTDKSEAEIVEELKVHKTTVKLWLERLVQEGVIEKRPKTKKYGLKSQPLLEF